MIIKQILFAVTLCGFGIGQATASDPFCTQGDWVVCDWPWVKALEDLSEDATPEEIEDLASVAVGPTNGLAAAGAARMLARELHRSGHAQAAFDLLDGARDSVMSADWGETALAWVSLAKQRHALGDPNPTNGLVPGAIDWPDRLTAYQRANFLKTLAIGLDDMDDRDRATDVFKWARNEARKAVQPMPDGTFGDRIETLANLWYSMQIRGYDALAAETATEVAALLRAAPPERRTRFFWPLTVEDFRAGPPGVSRIPE